MSASFTHSRYHLTSLIAIGGMGEVWATNDTLLDREVAVKVLRREYADDATFRARFETEARHAASLQHPNVAVVLDFGESPGDPVNGEPARPFLVMELVAGQPLSAYLESRGPMSPDQAATTIAQAAEGIQAAHQLGIIHRDVKPGNLLVTPEGQVKVTDFGIARAADAVALTATGQIVGTPHYLAPEQAEGKSSTPASDIYSLGIVLFECLTGSRPFGGDSPVTVALMQIRDPLPAMPSTVPEHLQAITRRATAKDPTERFASAADLAAALREEAPTTRTVVMPAPGASDATSTTITSATSEGAAAAPLIHRLRALPLVPAVIGTALVIMFLVVLLVRLTEPDEPPTPSAAADSVRVRAADYVGEPVDEASARLDDLGLNVATRDKTNPGGQVAGTVAGVSPVGSLSQDTTVTLAAWGSAPAPEPTGPSPAGKDHSGPSKSKADPPGKPGKDKPGNDKGKGGKK